MDTTRIELELDTALLGRADAAGLDLAALLEGAIRQVTQTGFAEVGAAFVHGPSAASADSERPEAVADYNRRIREYGCFGDVWRG